MFISQDTTAKKVLQDHRTQQDSDITLLRARKHNLKIEKEWRVFGSFYHIQEYLIYSVNL